MKLLSHSLDKVVVAGMDMKTKFAKLYVEFQEASGRLLGDSFFIFCWIFLAIHIVEGRYDDVLVGLSFIIFLIYYEVQLGRTSKLQFNNERYHWQWYDYIWIV